MFLDYFFVSLFTLSSEFKLHLKNSILLKITLGGVFRSNPIIL